MHSVIRFWKFGSRFAGISWMGRQYTPLKVFPNEVCDIATLEEPYVMVIIHKHQNIIKYRTIS